MEEYYVLLGVHPTSTAEEIEEAYLNKKRAAAQEQYKQGSVEWQNAVAMQSRLEKAYNDAIMATFAPIRAFSAPHLTEAQTSAPAQHLPRPETVRDLKPTATQRPTPPDFSPSKISHGEVFEGLVEEVPLSFSDKELLSMDIGQLRDSLKPQKKQRASFLTLGIEDKLLRYYVITYLSFTLLDLLMRLMMGAAWVGMSGIYSHYTAVLREGLSAGAAIPGASAVEPSTISAFAASVFSMLYLFFCSLIMPIVTRFFICGQPVGRAMTRWMLCVLSIFAALIVYAVTGFLFWLLPAEWAGSTTSLIFIAPSLCWVTLKYEGN